MTTYPWWTDRRSGGPGLTLRARLLAIRTSVLLWVGLSLCGGATVYAQDAPLSRFEQRVKDALTHYKEGAFLEAAEDFEAAHALEAQPELVYNIARSYEKALAQDEAIAAYERFVNLPGTTAALRTKALDALTALRKERAARDRARQAERSDVRAPAPIAVLQPERMTSTPARSRTLELTLIGAGIGLAGAGAIFGVLALDAESQWMAAQADGEPTARVEELVDQTRTHALVADILIGAGAVAAVSGVVVLLARGQENTRLSWGPQLTEDGAGLAVGGRF